MSDWHDLYHATMRQNDPALLDELAYELEAAIFYRFQELSGNHGWNVERAELRFAAAELNSIRIVKLGWPDPRKVIGSRKRKVRTSRLK